MKLANEFTVQIPIDDAWKVFTDLEGIAPCMPGAQLTGVEGEVYKGKVKIKVGPVISEFSGTAQFTAKDDAAYKAVIDAKGRDARSAGNASATVVAFLTAVDATSTRVNVDTDLKISGKLAQFGSGMIKEVSSKLLAQFVANLEKKLATETRAPAPSADAAPAVAPAADAAPAAVSAPASDAPASDAPASDAPASDAAVVTAPDTAFAVGAPAADGSAIAGEATAAAVAPDPSAGEVTEAAGRIEVAEGTPDPVAPLRTPGADLSDAPAVVAAVAAAPATETTPAASAADDSAPATSAPVPEAVPAAAPAVTPAAASDSVPAVTPDAAPATAPVVTPAAASDAAPAGASAEAAPAKAAPAATATVERKIESVEAEPLDLLEVAGGSIYKRLIPVAIGAVVVVGAVVAWVVAQG
ncbi:MAG TPA: SRPBCC family protein [Actinoplanes sp.]|nr:SRPBCC family protein [Actinoplanes sp.]